MISFRIFLRQWNTNSNFYFKEGQMPNFLWHMKRFFHWNMLMKTLAYFSLLFKDLMTQLQHFLFINVPVRPIKIFNLFNRITLRIFLFLLFINYRIVNAEWHIIFRFFCSPLVFHRLLVVDLVLSYVQTYLKCKFMLVDHAFAKYMKFNHLITNGIK